MRSASPMCGNDNNVRIERLTSKGVDNDSVDSEAASDVAAASYQDAECTRLQAAQCATRVRAGATTATRRRQTTESHPNSPHSLLFLSVTFEA